MTEIFTKKNLLILSQFLSALVFAVILIPKFIVATDPQSQKPLAEPAQPVSLIVLPSEATFSVGDIIPIQVAVHLWDQPINTVGVELLFPPDMVEVLRTDSQGSFCTLWPEDTFDNKTGVINYSCGLPNPGYSNPYGIVGTFYLRIKKPGFVNLTLSDNSQVLANDSLGTNILNHVAGAGYNIIDAENIFPHSELAPPSSESTPQTDQPALEESATPLGLVDVKSSTHPNQIKWYNDKNATFNWEKTTENALYSYVIDQKPDSKPDPTMLITDNISEYTDLEDGIWYFHVMQNTGERNGPVTHFKIQIDTDAPHDLRVTSVTPTGNENEFEIEFSCEDENGILYYKVDLGNREMFTVGKKTTIRLEDKYTNKITVTAYDLAGNTTSLEYEIPIEQPQNIWEKILYFVGQILKFLKEL